MSRHFNKNIKKIQPKTRGFAFKISKNPSFLPPKSYYIGLSLRKPTRFLRILLYNLKQFPLYRHLKLLTKI